MKKRVKILKKYDCRCAYCGIELSKTNLTVDHFYPRAKGGISSYRNLKPSCKLCNNIKAQLTIRDFKKRLIELSKKNDELSHKIKCRYDLENEDNKITFYFEKRNREKKEFIKLLYNN